MRSLAALCVALACPSPGGLPRPPGHLALAQRAGATSDSYLGDPARHVSTYMVHSPVPRLRECPCVENRAWGLRAATLHCTRTALAEHSRCYLSRCGLDSLRGAKQRGARLAKLSARPIGRLSPLYSGSVNPAMTLARRLQSPSIRRISARLALRPSSASARSTTYGSSTTSIAHMCCGKWGRGACRRRKRWWEQTVGSGKVTDVIVGTRVYT